MDTATALFESERRHLTAAAYRMLGSWAEAEDAVQEAWTRFAATDLDAIREPVAWLTTVVARICLDVLRSARVRHEAYVGPWLPEPLVERLPDRGAGGLGAGGIGADGFRAGAGTGFGADAGDPAELIEHREDVGLAMVLVMERLTPEQRVAFVLHDAFAFPFDEIAAILATTPEAARQLASRARRALATGRAAGTASLVQAATRPRPSEPAEPAESYADSAGAGRPEMGGAGTDGAGTDGADAAGAGAGAAGVGRTRTTLAEQRRAVLAFLTAAQSGDLNGLLAVLAPDAVAVGDGGGVTPAGPRPIEGAVAVARFVLGLFRRIGVDILMDMEEVLVNGDLGLLIEAHTRDGSPLPSRPEMAVSDSTRLVMAFDVVDGRIAAIFDQLNPAKLAHVPSLAALRSDAATRAIVDGSDAEATRPIQDPRM